MRAAGDDKARLTQGDESMDYPRTQSQAGPGAGERIARVAVVTFLGLAVVTLVFAAGYLTSELFSDDSGTTVVTQAGGDTSLGDPVLDEIYDLIESEFVGKDTLDPELLREAAINGVISALNDPHTAYLSPEDLSAGALDLSASFGGIGAQGSDTSGTIQIIAPLRDSPAEAAGIRPGDVILAVDGETTEGWTWETAVRRIRGEAGTQVTLTVQHSDGVVEDITITRGNIPNFSVFSEPFLEALPGVSGTDLVDREGNPVDDIGYIHISRFHEETDTEVREALAALNEQEGLRGLIIDLRLNPGGYLNTTVAVADEFLEGGTVLVERDGDGREQTWEATSGGLFTELPIVIIQDVSSASGAEVLAAALQDHGRATVVGTQSFGKGTVNRLEQLENCGEPQCGALYLSIGRWYRPNGEGIEGSGVTPDEVIELSLETYDAEGDLQLFAAIDALRAQ